MGVNGCMNGFTLRSDALQITPEILNLVAWIDESIQADAIFERILHGSHK